MNAEIKVKKKNGFQKFCKMGVADKVYVLVVYTTLILFTLVTLYPILFVLSASISDPQAVDSGKMLLLPINPGWDAYKTLLKYDDIWIGYANTFFYTIVGTIANLLVTIPAAYALSHRKLRGRNFFMILFMITMYFGGGLIPNYLNMRSFGLIDTRAIMIIDGLVSTYNLIVARTFFASSIPYELHEAAYLDGATDMKTFTKVVLPLSKPILAVMMLYYGEAHWNAYFNAMIYIRDKAKYPLQSVLKKILSEASGLGGMLNEVLDTETVVYLMGQQDMANQLKYAVIIVASVPMLILYPFLEKYFAKGVMIGSVKG